VVPPYNFMIFIKITLSLPLLDWWKVLYFMKAVILDNVIKRLRILYVVLSIKLTITY